MRRLSFALVVLAGISITLTSVHAADPVKHWSADDLKVGRGETLQTLTHRFTPIKKSAGDPVQAMSHEGTTDVIFVVGGAGTIVAGGEIDGGAALPGMPGEVRGPSIKGGQHYDLKPGAIINIPPSTPYSVQAAAGGLTAMDLRINVGMHPWSLVQTQQFTLDVTPARPRANVPTTTGQGGVVFWSADTVQRAHATMAAAAAAGKAISDPRDLVEIPVTRTHAYNFMHRVMGANGRPPAVEFHEGNTDIYFIIAGSGTLMTGGEIENPRKVANKPGEDQGTSIKNGTPLTLKAGDVVNMPPGTPHQSIPDPGGFTYMLVKVNVGTYPWSLIDH